MQKLKSFFELLYARMPSRIYHYDVLVTNKSGMVQIVSALVVLITLLAVFFFAGIKVALATVVALIALGVVTYQWTEIKKK